MARHWADGVTALDRQVRHSTDEKHGIRPTFDTAFDRRQAELVKSLQAMQDKACSDSSNTQKQAANLFIIFI
ncbi:hypothetical protein A1342_09220 [Methylomonas methanica]|uniref:Uncharacterized protein n=1 Tax=Methylomonas denitrificans TaxID=1538553 RepID=A0A140E7B3_9GAMM|nr:hypothetical protein JT25_022835 [Methylomonas denitrificans]OAI03278.1 hypothetical protein A1342_09220 [Methylomonas methanica]